jgi:DNA-binding NtrC family response regulator
MQEEDGVKRVTVLIALTSEAERQALGRILAHTNWTLLFANSLSTVRELLYHAREAVIVADSCFPDGNSWKDILHASRTEGIAAQIIVADRHAEHCLWAEVLNVGAYDLLVKPFRPDEVFRVISSAWRSLPGAIQPRIEYRSDRRIESDTIKL